MCDLRKDIGLGTVTSIAGGPKGMIAKFKIAELLEVNIRSLDIFKNQLGL